VYCLLFLGLIISIRRRLVNHELNIHGANSFYINLDFGGNDMFLWQEHNLMRFFLDFYRFFPLVFRDIQLSFVVVGYCQTIRIGVICAPISLKQNLADLLFSVYWRQLIPGTIWALVLFIYLVSIIILFLLLSVEWDFDHRFILVCTCFGTHMVTRKFEVQRIKVIFSMLDMGHFEFFHHSCAQKHRMLQRRHRQKCRLY